MARREIKMEELIEVLSQWHAGRSISQIKRSVGIARKTVRKYLNLAEGCGFSRDSEMQSYQYYLTLAGRVQQELRTPLESSASYKKTALYQHTIEKLLGKRYMTPKQVYRILKREYEYPLSYSSFNRYMNIKYPKKPSNCIRIEVRAGEEAQVDFGGAGMMYDAERSEMRRAHAFIMTLSYSRLPYVEFVFDQGQTTWVQCHMRAFEFFGGVPERIVLDNLKSGILKPHTYDPIFNQAYAECARHYGFVIDPTKVRMARHKGKVERKVPVVRQQFLSSHERIDLREANYEVKKWCLDEYGMEIHGTIKQKPYQVFTEEEKPQLQKLPRERFDLPLWKEARVHPDHHVVFEKSYYSLPTRYIGKKVWVRGGLDTVRVFFDGELIKTHQRSYRPGSFKTDERDYPPEKSKYVLKTTSYYQREALQYGGYVCQVVRRVMKEHTYRNLRKVQGIFRLADKYGAEALNLACKRCLFYEDYRMSTIKRILDKKLYEAPLEEEDVAPALKSSPEGLSFIRSPQYFIHREEVKS
jgi:transposase